MSKLIGFLLWVGALAGALWRPALLLLSFCALSPAQDNGVSITWIGQACFFIRSDSGLVVTDPPAASVGYTIPPASPVAVTVSHNHTDHNNTAAFPSATLVDGRPVTARTQVSAGAFAFTLVPGFHDNQNGTTRGSNTLVKWTQGGLVLAHLGDYGQDTLTAAQLADLQGVDVLFVAGGGFFTIEPPAVAALIAQLKPRVAVLMHFKTALGGPAQLAGFPAIVAPYAEVVFKPSTVQLSKTALPQNSEVWFMEPAGEAAVVNSAGFAAGIPVAPVSLASVFGDFAGSAADQQASALPLPRTIGQTQVLVDGSAVPLLFAGRRQVNFQVPRATATGQSLVEVRINQQRVARGAMTVTPTAPGVFAVLNQDGTLNTGSRPAQRGQVLQIFATGQGAVAPPVQDGEAGGSGSAVSVAPGLPEVLMGGKRAAVQFSGLAPGLVGVWQINAVIPADAPAGSAVSLIVNQALASPPVPVAIQ